MKKTKKESALMRDNTSNVIVQDSRAALKAFQRDHGMSATGTANQEVIDALYEAATPTPRPTPTPYAEE